MKNITSGYKIPHFGLARQYSNLREELLTATDSALKDGIFIGGHYTSTFEDWLRTYTKASYAITVHSGTQALEIIARYAKSNEYRATVVIPNITYPATLNAFLNAGLNVIIEDTDKYGLLSLNNIQHHICKVGLYGAQYTTHETIIDGAQHWLVEENLPTAIGMAISFDPTKNLPSSGNGGAIVTYSKGLYDFARSYRDNDKNIHELVGTNSKMSEQECAHLLVRTNYIGAWQKRRKEIRKYYLDRFIDLPIRCLSRPFSIHADQKFVIYTENRDELRQYMKQNGVETKIHYNKTLSELPVASKLVKPDMLSVSVMLVRGLLSLPIYPELTDSEVECVADIVCKFYK